MTWPLALVAVTALLVLLGIVSKAIEARTPTRHRCNAAAEWQTSNRAWGTYYCDRERGHDGMHADGRNYWVRLTNGDTGWRYPHDTPPLPPRAYTANDGIDD